MLCTWVTNVLCHIFLEGGRISLHLQKYFALFKIFIPTSLQFFSLLTVYLIGSSLYAFLGHLPLLLLIPILAIKNSEKCMKDQCRLFNFSDINHSRILYDPPPRVLEIKAKISKWDLIKLKSFCTTKDTISKVKRQPSEQEKIIANEATDKELISKIYKQLLQLNSKNK